MRNRLRRVVCLPDPRVAVPSVGVPSVGDPAPDDSAVVGAVLAISIYSQVLQRRLLGNPDGLSQRNLGQIVGVHTGDVRLFGGGDRLLGLDDLEIVRNPGEEAVLGLLQRLACKIDVALGHGDQIGGGVQVQECRAHLIVNLSTQILKFGLALPQGAIGLELIRSHARALKNRDHQAGLKGEDAMRGTKIGTAGVAEVGVKGECRVVLRSRCLLRKLAGTHLFPWR